MFGCASLPGTDLDALAPALSFLHHNHLAPPWLCPRALAHRRVPMDRLDPGGIDLRAALAELPPLVKGYLRLGGFVGSGAVLDTQFNTTDVCIVVKTDLITANPKIVGVFASNLIMAQGVGQAIAENKLGDKVKVIGFDSDDKTIGFLKSGSLAGLVVQDPYRMGYDGIKTALAASKKEKVEANVDTGANLVTKANMAEPKIDALLNPKIN